MLLRTQLGVGQLVWIVGLESWLSLMSTFRDGFQPLDIDFNPWRGPNMLDSYMIEIDGELVG
jgi:hypothetical protein